MVAAHRAQRDSQKSAGAVCNSRSFWSAVERVTTLSSVGQGEPSPLRQQQCRERSDHRERAEEQLHLVRSE